MSTIPYRLRLVERVARELLEQLPALLLVGPRACGKTTTAARMARTVVRLDRSSEAAAFVADPDVALSGLSEPILLDEWQAVPTILGAVKRAVDGTPGAGRFILTGSVRAELQAETWPGTGRLVRLRMLPLTVAERMQRPTRPLLDRIVAREELRPAPEMVDLRGYVELALSSGFPEATLATSEEVRRRWLESYVDQLVTRDAPELQAVRDPARLRRFFEAYALNTAGIVSDSTLCEPAGINRKTGVTYDRLLSNLLVVESLPAWTSNRLKRWALSPKRYLVDPGLMVGALGIDTAAVLRNGDLLGRTLDTFVTAHLRAEAEVSHTRPRMYHLRTAEGRQEVDLLIEFGAGDVVAFEIKASSAPDSGSARHLAWLRDHLGERFVAGVVLHTGPKTFELGDRIVAAPISTLWA
ncbi:MAG: ATP-binding protein [Planctomycetes bacterium]|nr:ATP-binding protein [Planctomycetota bacterium]